MPSRGKELKRPAIVRLHNRHGLGLMSEGGEVRCCEGKNIYLDYGGIKFPARPFVPNWQCLLKIQQTVPIILSIRTRVHHFQRVCWAKPRRGRKLVRCTVQYSMWKTGLLAVMKGRKVLHSLRSMHSLLASHCTLSHLFHSNQSKMTRQGRCHCQRCLRYSLDSKAVGGS